MTGMMLINTKFDFLFIDGPNLISKIKIINL